MAVSKRAPKTTAKAAAEAAAKAEALVKKVAAEVKTAEVKEAAAEVVAEVKEAAKTVKKAAEKKAPAKRVTKKATVHVQFANKDIVAKDILTAAEKAFKAANPGVAIKTIELYIVAEEQAAYYVVNGVGSDDYKIML